MISRELFGAHDSAAKFYMQGSMGHAIGLGLGTALARPDTQVIVLDGDGSALMHLGGLALVGERRPANLMHVILDNGTYDSTGGQPTRREAMPWDRLAHAVGYGTAAVCDTAEGIHDRMAVTIGEPGPHLLGCGSPLAAVACRPGSPPDSPTSRSGPVSSRRPWQVSCPRSRVGQRDHHVHISDLHLDVCRVTPEGFVALT
jgi:phosphonopyruvate decarboxylase